MKIQIKKLITLDVLFETEASSTKECLEKAVANNVNLSGADLRGADLRDADLSNADLSGADLIGADLRDADLSNADLSSADLYDADLSNADLSGANLIGANLSSADLYGADLSNADLSGADLSSADLYDANLSSANLYDANWDDTKKDMIEKMSLMPNEVPYLYKSILDGKINGSVYEGECACFCGTLANALGTKYTQIKIKTDASSPVEVFFGQIQKGDTPENNPISRLAAEWIIEFCKERNIQLPKKEVVWR